MRVLLKLLVVLGAAVTFAWIGGEMLLARKAAALIAADPQLEAAAVHELRDPRRVGVRVERLGLQGTAGAVALPWLELWVPPQRINEVHATLPATAQAVVDGRSVTLAAEGAGLSARFAPANGMALGRAQVGTGRVSVDGRPLAQRIVVAAHLVGFGADAPRAAGAAYEVSVDMVGVELATLTEGAATGLAAVSGTGRLWLDGAPARGGSAGAPRLVGLRADGVELRLDDLAARVWGRVVADAQGRAEGMVLIDTADAEGLVARAGALGLLPPATVTLAGGLLRNLREGADAVVPAAAAGSGLAPPPRTGELRIPISFRDGRSWLGPLPIGPAPSFPR